MKRDAPGFDDYLATGALANVPLWIYRLLLTFDVNKYSLSDLTVFYTIIPIITMLVGGFVSSYLLCRRSVRGFLRIGLLVGVAATIVNFAFGLATSGPPVIVVAVIFVAVICFVGSSVLAAVLKQKRSRDLGTIG